MSRRIYSEDLVLNLIINGKDMPTANKAALNELYKLDRATRDLEIELAKVEVAQRKLGKRTAQNAAEFDKLKRSAENLKVQISQNHAAMNKLRENIGRTGLTINQLNSYLKVLNIQLANTTDKGSLAKLRKEIRLTEDRIKQLRTGASRLSVAFERLGTVANKFGTVTSWIAIVTYAVMRAVGGTVGTLRELDKTFSNVMKTTGLTRKELWALKEQFDQLNLEEGMKTPTATKDLLEIARIAGRLGVRGVKDIAEFTMAVDKLYVALGEDLEGSVEDVAEKIGKLVTTFKLTDEMELGEAMLRAGSLINELSKSSAAGAETILNYTSRLGGVGSMAKFTMDQLAGMGAALDAVGVPAERGSTALAKLITGMGENAEEFSRALGMSIEDYRKAMETNINDTMLQLVKASAAGNESIMDVVAGMDKMDVSGVRVMEVYGKLVQNMELVNEQQAIAKMAFASSASVMNEFYIMSKDFDSLMAIQGKRWKALRDEYAKGVAPAVYKIYRGFTDLAYGIKDVVLWIGRHIYLLKAMVALWVAFKSTAIVQFIVKAAVALKVFTVELVRTTQMTLLNNLAIKNMYIAYTQAGGGIRGVTAAMKALFATVATNPFSALVAVVGLVAGAFFLFKRRTDELQKAISETNAEVMSQTVALKFMFDAIKKANEGTKQRSNLIEQANLLYGEYLPKLIDEKDSVDDLTEAYNQASAAMEKKIRIEAANTKLGELTNTFEKNISKHINSLFKFIEDPRIRGFVKRNFRDVLDEIEDWTKISVDEMTDVTTKAHEVIMGYGLNEKELDIILQKSFNNLLAIYKNRAKLEKVKSEFIGEFEGTEDAFFEAQKNIAKNTEGFLPKISEEQYDEATKGLERWYKQQLTLNQEYANKMRLSKKQIEDNNRKTEMEYIDKQIELEKDKYTRLGYVTQDGVKKMVPGLFRFDEDSMKQSDKYVDLMLEKAKLMGEKLGIGAKEQEVKAEKTVKMIDIAKLRAQTLREGQERDIAEEEARYAAELKEFELTEAEKIILKKKSAEEQKKIEDNRKEAAEIAEQKHKTNLAEINLKYLDKQLADDNVTYAQKIVILEDELNRQLITEEEYARRKAEITRDYETDMLAYKRRYGVLVEETLQDEIAMFKRSEFYALLTEEEKQKGIEAIRRKYDEKRERTFKTNIEKELEDIKEKFEVFQHEAFVQGESLVGIWQNVGQGIGDAFTAMFDDTQKGFSAFAKQIVLMAIEVAAQLARAQYPVILAKNIATYGNVPGGTAIALSKTAKQIALIEAAFATARGLVTAFWKTEKPQKTEQYAGGSYPVMGANDGKKYNAQYVGPVRTGIYRKPSLGLFAERPEMVIDYPTLRRIQFNNPALIDAIMRHRDGNGTGERESGRTKTKQYAEGNYPDEMERGYNGYDPEMKELLRKNTAAVENLMKWKPKVATELIRKDLETLERIDRNRGM